MFGILGVVLGSGIGAWLLMWNADRAGRKADARLDASEKAVRDHERALDAEYKRLDAQELAYLKGGTVVNRGAW